jgi:hypothetical protein
VDATVDPLGDRHRFTAQLAALDAVVTISQTCAHMAGAVDIPMTVLHGGHFLLSWPKIRSTSPAVLDAAAERLARSG